MRDPFDMPPERKAPCNLDAEQALLGAILVNNEAHDRVSGFLEPRHFFDPLHGAIYEAAAKLIAVGRQANPITLKTYFEGAEPVGPTPVPVYLGQLAANATTIINAKDYARTIRDLATCRGLIEIGETMVNAAYDSPVDFPPREQIEEAERRLYALAEHGNGGGVEVTAAQMQAEAMSYIEEASRGAVVALPMGLAALDKYRLLRPGRLIILAGRPSMGKTSLATDVTRVQEVPVHFFSAEMTTVEIGMRRFSVETRLPSDHLDGGDLSSEDWGRIIAAEKKLGSQKLYIDPTGALTIAQLSTRARRVKRQHGTGLVVVDYLQLLRGTRRENRVVEVSEITAGLKALAKELNVPVLALSQLSRAVEERTDKRPQLSDLRDSGSIEQDADVVMFVFREAYYLERIQTPKLEESARLEAVRNLAEIIVSKNRNGPVGVATVQFDAPTAHFSNLARSGQAHDQP